MAGNDVFLQQTRDNILFWGLMPDSMWLLREIIYIHIHRHTDTYFNLLFVFLLFSYFEAFQHMPLNEGFRRHALNYIVIESHTGTPWISAECRQGYPTSIKALSFQSIIIKRKQLHLQMAKMPIDQRFMLNIMWCDWTWCSALILSWTAPVNPSHVKDTNCQEN